MLFNIRDVKTSLVEKFGEAVIYLQDLSGNESFIVNPSYQLCVFNYLLFEKDWKFDTLKDIALSFNPEFNSCEYSLQYQLNSKLFNNRLKLLLPVNLSKRQVYSLSNRYNNALKMEKEIESIYKIQFVTKPTKLARIRKRLSETMNPIITNLPLPTFF
ncbi:MAG: NADH-quinone oxidoreductase subunit C [Lacibacter sp.]